MADKAAFLASLQNYVAQAATDLAAAKTAVITKTEELASVTAAHAAADAEHLAALASLEAAKVGKFVGAAASEVAKDAGIAWKWLLGVGLPAAGGAAGALWAFWPK